MYHLLGIFCSRYLRSVEEEILVVTDVLVIYVSLSSKTNYVCQVIRCKADFKECNWRGGIDARISEHVRYECVRDNRRD